MRNAWKLLSILAMLAVVAAAPVLASVPKVIFSDEFGYAT